jgi:DNA-binding NtrC family response regulator
MRQPRRRQDTKEWKIFDHSSRLRVFAPSRSNFLGKTRSSNVIGAQAPPRHRRVAIVRWILFFVSSAYARAMPAAPAREAILLVDDDGAFRTVYAQLLRAEGYEVAEAGDAAQAWARIASAPPRLVVLDLMLPPRGTPEEGSALLERILTRDPAIKVIVVSGAGEGPLALSLVRRGAYDFLSKPVDPDVLVSVCARAAARLALEDRVSELEASLASSLRSEVGLLGSAPPFVEARTIAERAAATDVPILITGESGTGKDVLARYVHARSPRASKPLVAVNCGALSPALLESTLFGHRRGAFTGAVGDARGLFVEADGSTLFLDEIGDLDLPLQVKLLRALESGEVLPVGASRPVTVDVRLVSATNRPLGEMVAAKTFRDDLYWRIRGIEIPLPRLAARAEDLAPLAQHFLNQARALVPRAAAARLSPEAIRRLEGYEWPGNLRELRHEMQRALVMAAGRDEILEADLSPALRPIARASSLSEPRDDAPLDEKIAALERREIERALAATGGNRSHAALRLGLSRQGLLNKMARHGIGE